METALLEDMYSMLDERGFAVKYLTADQDTKLPPLIKLLNRRHSMRSQLKTDVAHLIKNMAKKLHEFIKSDDPTLKNIDKKTKALCTLDWCRGVSKFASNSIIKHRKTGTIQKIKKDVDNSLFHLLPYG